MAKGEQTKHAILEHAAQVSSRDGLDGLTIGRLAEDMHLSKSGLFAHFRSKEALQDQTLRFVAELFVERVVRPALKAPRGEARVKALFERWLDWARASSLQGGCLFVTASVELDDGEGPLRDLVVAQQRDFLALIAGVAQTAVNEGHFRADLDAFQFAYEMHGMMLAYHHSRRLLRDPLSDGHARVSFERLVAFARGSAGRPAQAQGGLE